MKRIIFFFLAVFLVATTMSLKGQTTIEITIDCTSKTEVSSTMVDAASDAAGTNRNDITNVTFSNADDITSIENGAFLNCSSLRELTLPANLQSIGNGAFSGCSSLEEVTLPANLQSIGEAAFSGCRSLLEVTLPANLQSIGNYAFAYCSLLLEVTFLSCVPPEIQPPLGNPFNGLTGLTLKVPNGCSGNYTDSLWNNYTIIEPPTLRIGGDLIINNSKVKFGD